jgi:hypothetical protein
MRIAKTLLCAALTLSPAYSEPLSSVDREALLMNLDKLRESADARVDARFRMAIAAYREAMASGDAAKEFYLKCLEKVEFEDRQKKASDFREWKRKEAEKLADPALAIALRIQLQWLVLTLQAASEEADRAKLASGAFELVSAIFQDPEKLRSQAGLLSEDVTSSVFARAYEIGNLKLEDWSGSPTALETIYDKILLPPLRNPQHLDSLRNAWIKRIQQEGAMQEFWAAPPKENKRLGMAEDLRPPEYARFLEETLPRLQWQMEVDLFKNGDESDAAKRMLAHIEKYIQHKAAREWGEEFRKLLAPGAAPAPPAGEPPLTAE